MLHMNNCTHSACMYSAYLMCLYVSYMWCVSIFVYAAHMKKDALYVPVYMPNMCSKVTGMYAACMLYTCLILYVQKGSVKDKAKYIVCQNGRSKSSLICQNPV